MRWISALLWGQACTWSSVYGLFACLNVGDRIRTAGDASAWAYGAYLMTNAEIMELYAEAIFEEDAWCSGIRRDDIAHRQTLEAINLLIRLRLWCKEWKQERATLEVRAENGT